MDIIEAMRNVKDCVHGAMYEFNTTPEQNTYDEESLTIVEEAVKKQIPMKPTYDHRYAELGCSFCGNQVGGWEERPNYCPNCGQAIDWED